MKNPQIVMAALRDTMPDFPDLRVGQYLSNAVAWYNQNSQKAQYMDRAGQPDLYYIEDHELANIIRMYAMTFTCKECGGLHNKHFLNCSTWNLKVVP